MPLILVADDDPTVVIALQFLLEQAGFKVAAARDGQEALEAMQRDVPDLLLLDVMMPRLSGYDVCERVRGSPAWRHVPIIMLTAKGGIVEARKGLALGADAYMTKPFGTQELLGRINELLARRTCESDQVSASSSPAAMRTPVIEPSAA